MRSANLSIYLEIRLILTASGAISVWSSQQPKRLKFKIVRCSAKLLRSNQKMCPVSMTKVNSEFTQMK